MQHHGKWKRRLPHTVPVLHRTLHRIDMERDRRHDGSFRVMRWLIAAVAFAFGLALLFAFLQLHISSQAPDRNSGYNFAHPPH